MNHDAPRSAGFPIGSGEVPLPAPTLVKYELGPEELAESFVYQAVHNAAMRNAARRYFLRELLWLLACMVAPAWIAAGYRSPHRSDASGAMVPVYIAIGSWLFICVVGLLARTRRKTAVEDGYRRYYRRLAGDEFYAALLGPYRLELKPDGVTQVSKHREVRVHWAGVDAIVVSPAVTYLDLGPAGQFVVPSRAFGDDATYWAFVRQAREYKAAVDRTESP